MATIVSRCEVIRLRPLSLNVLGQALQTDLGMPSDQAVLLSHLSAGCPGLAIQLYQDTQRLAQRQDWLDDLRQLRGSSRVERFARAEALAKDKESLRSILQVWLSFWRDVMLRASGSSSPLVNLDRATEIESLSAQLSLGISYCTVQAFERTLILLDQNVNPRLALEVLMLDLPFK